MANKLSIYAVDTSKDLVQGPTNGGAFQLPSFVQNDVMPVELTLLTRNPAGGFLAPFSRVTDQQVVKVGVVTPHSTSPVVHAIGTLSFVASVGSYSGSLSLATQEVADLLGASTTASATFEIEVTGGANSIYTIQKPVTVAADGLKVGTPVAITGSQTFYDASQVDALFLGKNRADSITSQTVITVENTAGEAKFTRDTDAKSFNFGSWTGAAWSNNSDTIATRGDVVLITGGTATGEIHYAANPSHANALARKSYVDAQALAGGTLTGALHYTGSDEHPDALATTAFVLAHSSVPIIDSTLAFTGSTLGVNVLVTGSQVGYTHRHVTAQVDEESGPQYFTAARVLATPLTALDTSNQGAVTSSDTVLSAAGKLQASKLSTVTGGTVASPVYFPAGSAGTPSISAIGDTNCGVYFPAGGDKVAVTLGGAEVARFTDASLLLGTSTADAGKLTVVGTTNAVQAKIFGNSSQSVDIAAISTSDASAGLAVSQYGGALITSAGFVGGDHASSKGLTLLATNALADARLILRTTAGGGGSWVSLHGPSATTPDTMELYNSNQGGALRIKEGVTADPWLAVAAQTSAPASLVDGAIWQNSTYNVVNAYVKRDFALSGVLYSANGAKTTSNTDVETTIIASGPGSLTLPANYLKIGKMLRFTAMGLLSTAGSPGQLGVTAKLGGTTIFSSGSFALPASSSEGLWDLRGLWTLKSTGAGGSGRGHGFLTYYDTASATSIIQEMKTFAVAIIDTTTSNTIDVTAQFSTADAANILQTTNFIVEVLN